MQDASIIARLGLDTAGFRKGLNDAAASKRSFAKDATGANESLLESEKKVESQLGGLVERLKGVESAGGAATTVIEAFAESINLKLGTAIGVSAVLGFVGYLQDIGKESRAASQELEKLLKPTGSPDFQSLDALVTRVETLKGKLAELTAEKGPAEKFGDLLANSFIASGKGGTGFLGLPSFSDIEDQKTSEIKRTKEAIAQSEAASLETARQKTKLMELEAAGLKDAVKLEQIRAEYARKIADAKTSGHPELESEFRKQQGMEENTVRVEAARRTAAKVSEIADEQAKVAMDQVRAEMNAQHTLQEQDKDHAAKAEEEKRAQAKLTAAERKKLGEDLNKHMAALGDRFREEEKKKDEAAAAAAAARAEARADFISGKLGGPDAAREAGRRRRDEKRLGDQFDRMEDLDERKGKAAADVNREKLADALKPRPKGPTDDLLGKDHKGPLDRKGELDRKGPDGGGKSVTAEDAVGELKTANGYLKTIAGKFGVNL